MKTEQGTATETATKPWWDRTWITEWSFEDWLAEWEKNRSVAGACGLLERIFGEIPYWAKQARFLLTLMQELPQEARTTVRIPPWNEPVAVVIRNKAIELFVTKFLKPSKAIDIFDDEPSWMYVVCRDAEAGGTLYADTLAWLADRLNPPLDSETHHYRSIVKRFLMSCAMDRDRFNDAEEYLKLRDANLIVLCRAMLHYELGDAIGDADDKWIAALRTIVFEERGGVRPLDLIDAMSWESRLPAAQRLQNLQAIAESRRRRQRQEEREGR